jgi:peptidoglycan/LPS O-acetylase OafA/YrhL
MCAPCGRVSVGAAFKRPVLLRGAVFTVTVAVMLAIFYGVTDMYNHKVPNWSKARLVMYSSLSRPVWGLGLGVLSLLWFSAPSNWISRALSAGFWEPIARLSYGAYIVHPIVLFSVYSAATQAPRYSVLQLGFNFAGAYFLTYACSAVLFLFIEKPFMSMEVLLFKRLGLGGGGD